jgi:taurine dioxygenase
MKEYNLDLNEVSDFKPFLTELTTEMILVFKNQNLKEKKLVELCKQYGRFQLTNIWCNHPEYPEIFRVTNRIIDEKENKKGLFSGKNLDWHCNGHFSKDPEEVVALYCIAPGINSCTSYIDGRAAFEALSDSDKQRALNSNITMCNIPKTTIMNQKVYDVNDYEQDELNKIWSRTRDGTDEKNDKQVKYKKVPLVRQHPISKVNGLYFPFLNVAKISDDKNNEFFNFLVDHYLKFRYDHWWKANELVIADQTMGLHKRNEIKGDRELHRLAFWYNLEA